MTPLPPRSSVTTTYPPPVLTRGDLVWRYGVALGIAVLSLLGSIWSPIIDDRPYGPRDVVIIVAELLTAGVSTVLIGWRRRRPLLVVLILLVLSIPVGGALGFMSWAYLSLVTHRRPRQIALAAAAIFLGSVVSPYLSLTSPIPLDGTVAWGDFLVFVVVSLLTVAALTAWGLYVGTRRDLIASLQEQVDQMHREQELRVLTAQAEERGRIAREMHDVLAHRLSLVALHAGALAFRTDLPPDEMREVAGTIRDNARSSLAELRTILGSLRDTSELPAGTLVERPQPVLADLDELVVAHRGLGGRIEVLDTMDHPELLPAVTGRHAYRIVQEALTNARKHAPGSPVTLALAGAPNAGLQITVTNPTSTGAGFPGSGLGLVGVEERARALGGRVSQTVRDGDFRLEVQLPW